MNILARIGDALTRWADRRLARLIVAECNKACGWMQGVTVYPCGRKQWCGCKRCPDDH